MASLSTISGKDELAESPLEQVYELLLQYGFERTTLFRTPGFKDGLTKDNVEISSLFQSDHPNTANIFISIPIFVDRNFPLPPGFFFRFLGNGWGFPGTRIEIDPSLEVSDQIGEIFHAVAEGNRLASRNRQWLIPYVQ